MMHEPFFDGGTEAWNRWINVLSDAYIFFPEDFPLECPGSDAAAATFRFDIQFDALRFPGRVICNF